MRQKPEATKPSAEKVIKDIRRVTRKQYGAEEKIRIVLDGLRGEESIAALCRREGLAESLYYPSKHQDASPRLRTRKISATNRNVEAPGMGQGCRTTHRHPVRRTGCGRQGRGD